MQGRVLVIGGSDSGGGAGIQGDIKTVTMLGGYAMSAVTALTVQDTRRIHAIHATPAEIVRAQIRTALDDIGADAIKTGMLWSEEILTAVAAELDAGIGDAKLVVDPVIMAKGGQLLLEPGGKGGMRAEMFLRATVITPNIPEAESLTGLTIKTLDDMQHAAEMLLTYGPEAVLLKGGHLDRDDLVDVLVTQDEVHMFESQRIHTQHTHGTGCAMSSAIAVSLAQGMSIPEAVDRARHYVLKAIRTAPEFGEGHGPLNHCHPLDDSEL